MNEAIRSVIPRRRRVWWVLTGLETVLAALVFLSVLITPYYDSVAAGVLGGDAVWKWCIGLFFAAVAKRWVDDSDDPGSSSQPRYRRWSLVALLALLLVTIVAFANGIRDLNHWGVANGHDQPQYYAYLHSWVFDRDLQFANEYAQMPGIQDLMHEHYDPNHNVAPIGTPVLWMPFYLLAHGVMLGFARFDASFRADGISTPYAMAVAFGSIVLAWIGLFLVYSVIRKRISDRSALFTAMLVWLTTPLLWYLIDEPWMSHACSFFACSAVLYAWDTTGTERTVRQWALLGAAIGVAALVRPNDLLLLALPILDVSTTVARGKSNRTIWAGAAACVAFSLLAFAPQLITWALRTGLGVPPGNPLKPFQPAVLGILFSAFHGLIAWHPITALGFIGLIPLWRRHRHVAIGLAIVITLEIYANAVITSWWGGGAFGMRRFVGVLPFLALGIGAAGAWLVEQARRRPGIFASIFLGGLTVYNLLFMTLMRDHYILPAAPVSFGEVWPAQAGLFHARFGNVFSYPANLWFAWRHDTHPSQYDTVAYEEPILGPTEYEANVLRYHLGTGWALDRRDALLKGELVAEERICTLLLPLSDDHSYDVELHFAVAGQLRQPQEVAFTLNGKPIGSAEMPANEVSILSLHLNRADVLDGINTLGMAFAAVAEVPRNFRGPYYGGEGLEVRTQRPLNYAATLTKVRIAPASS